MDSATSLRSALPLILVAIVAGSLGWACFGERGLLANRGLESERLARLDAVAARKVTIAHLRTELALLRTDPVVQERWIREELGYVRPGEIVYFFPGDQAADFDVVEDRRLQETKLSGRTP